MKKRRNETNFSSWWLINDVIIQKEEKKKGAKYSETIECQIQEREKQGATPLRTVCPVQLS